MNLKDFLFSYFESFKIDLVKKKYFKAFRKLFNYPYKFFLDKLRQLFSLKKNNLDKNNKNFRNKIGDIIYTSGLGGIFIKDMEIGFISSINSFSINEVEVLITLKANPLEETLYGIMSKEADEI